MLTKEEKVQLFRSLFRGREDVFARRWQKYEGGVSGYSPVYKNWKKKGEYEPLSDKHIESHLLGNTTLGVYPLLTDNTSYFAAIDFDGEQWKTDIERMLKVCTKHNIPVYVERSRSGSGGHVWCFFQDAYPAHKSRVIFLTLLRQAQQIDEFDKNDSFDRMFPNQDYLSGKGLGNLIALPLQGQSRKQGNAVFVDVQNDFAIYDDQWHVLKHAERPTTEKLDTLYAEAMQGNEESTTCRRVFRKNELEAVLKNTIVLPKRSMTTQLSNYLRDELNFLNAEYIVRQRMGYSPYNLEKYFKTIQTVGSDIHIPRGFLEPLRRFCSEQGIVLNIIDERSQGEKVAYHPQYSLRPYQENAVSVLKHAQSGVLVAPPGSGKTLMAIALMAALKRTTLVLTHRRQIHDQWIEQLHAFLGIPKKDIGRYAGTKKTVGSSVTVAMVQTLARMSPEALADIRHKFGVIIVDECHHMPARMFRDVVSVFNPTNLFGLTATPKRKNNDEKLIYAYIGEIAHTIESNDVRTCANDAVDAYATSAVDVVVRTTETSVPFTPKMVDFNTIARILSNDSARNAQIRADVLAYVQQGRSCLILTERKEHADMLYYYLKRDVETIFMTGDLTPKKREATEKRIREHDFQVLIATGHILGEGADIPVLDCLFLAFPVAFEGKLVQYIGRIQRSNTGTRTVVDYRDSNIELLDKMFKKRQRYYKKLGV